MPAATAAAEPLELPGRVREIARVASRRRRPVRERRGVRLAHHDAAARAQIADDRRVRAADPPLVDRRSVLGRETCGLDDVFHAERDRGERAAAGWLLGRHLHPGVNLRVELADATDGRRQRAIPRLARRTLPVEERLEALRLGASTTTRERLCSDDGRSAGKQGSAIHTRSLERVTVAQAVRPPRRPCGSPEGLRYRHLMSRSLARMVLTFDVLLDIVAVEPHVAQVAGRVALGLIAEVLRLRIAALAARGHRPGAHPIAEP